MGMPDYEELRAVLAAAAEQMAKAESNPRPWLASIVYFLQALEQKAQDSNPAHEQAYEDMLVALIDVIRNRTKTGGW